MTILPARTSQETMAPRGAPADTRPQAPKSHEFPPPQCRGRTWTLTTSVHGDFGRWRLSTCPKRLWGLHYLRTKVAVELNTKAGCSELFPSSRRRYFQKHPHRSQTLWASIVLLETWNYSAWPPTIDPEGNLFSKGLPELNRPTAMFWILEDTDVNSQVTQALLGHPAFSPDPFHVLQHHQACLHLIPTVLREVELPAERVEDIFTSQVHYSITQGQSRAGQLFLGRVTETSHPQPSLCSSPPRNQAGWAPTNCSQFPPDTAWTTSTNAGGFAFGSYSSPHPKGCDSWSRQGPRSTPTGANSHRSLPARPGRLVPQPWRVLHPGLLSAHTQLSRSSPPCRETWVTSWPRLRSSWVRALPTKPVPPPRAEAGVTGWRPTPAPRGLRSCPCGPALPASRCHALCPTAGTRANGASSHLRPQHSPAGPAPPRSPHRGPARLRRALRPSAPVPRAGRAPRSSRSRLNSPRRAKPRGRRARTHPPAPAWLRPVRARLPGTPARVAGGG